LPGKRHPSAKQVASNCTKTKKKMFGTSISGVIRFHFVESFSLSYGRHKMTYPKPEVRQKVRLKGEKKAEVTKNLKHEPSQKRQ
jgi:hypothetical protein